MRFSVARDEPGTAEEVAACAILPGVESDDTPPALLLLLLLLGVMWLGEDCSASRPLPADD